MARKKSFIHFARVLASRIAEYSDGQISAVPKPDASVHEWKFAGVSEDALFPLEFLHDMKDLQNEPSYDLYARREKWEEISRESDEAAAIVIYAMTKPSKPFLYLPTLLYLAQHPRVPMSQLRSIYTSGRCSFKSLSVCSFSHRQRRSRPRRIRPGVDAESISVSKSCSCTRFWRVI